ncbi:MAG: glycosyltransferase family 2 protein [Chloroflexota bacterium]|nr:glycosyltransferase family 2 protein [Chloroflexota bacterium]
MIRLSICIATLNRGAFIGETLESIIRQATDEVEIVVVDGASTDNTEEVVRGFQQRWPRLNYLRLPEKGGVDRDYDRAVVLAKGNYCWLMSDDDLLTPGAVSAVLAAAGRGFSLVIVNSEVRSADLSSVIVPRLVPLSTDRAYGARDMAALLSDTAAYMSFIGCVVIRRELWVARERERYYGTEFIHVGVIFQSPLPDGALALASPGISIRAGNASWTGRYFEIWCFKWPGLIWSFPGYPDEARRRVCPREPWRAVKILLVLRAKGAYSACEYARWLPPRLHRRRARLVARAIALLPGVVTNAAVLAYFRWRRPAELYGIWEFTASRFYYRTWLRGVWQGLRSHLPISFSAGGKE